MKKLFLMAVAAMALTACGNGNSAATEEAAEDMVEVAGESSEDLNALIETVTKAATKIDADTKALIEKAAKDEATPEEKQTLLQKLKKIGAEVVVGDKTLEGGVEAAKEAVAGSGDEAKELINKATDGAVDKAEAANAKVEETKQKVEAVKESAAQLKGAIDALKKKN